MNALVAEKMARSVGPKRGVSSLYYPRLKAARCLASGWTMEQATGRCSEYGWARQFDKSPRRPLASLAAAERAVRA